MIARQPEVPVFAPLREPLLLSATLVFGNLLVIRSMAISSIYRLAILLVVEGVICSLFLVRMIMSWRAATGSVAAEPVPAIGYVTKGGSTVSDVDKWYRNYRARHQAREVMYRTLRARYLSCEDCEQLNEMEQAIFDHTKQAAGSWTSGRATSGSMHPGIESGSGSALRTVYGIPGNREQSQE